MVRNFAAIALLATLGACMMQESKLAETVESERLPLAGCDAAPAAGLVGERATAPTVEQARRLSHASEVRTIRPGDAVAMDYRSGRLNLELDAAGLIVSLRCG